MLKLFLVPLLTIGALVALNSSAGGGATPEVTVSTLQEPSEPVIVNHSDLVVSAVAVDGDALEVSVVADLQGSTEAATMTFLLPAGSEIAFALPGQPEQIFSFGRESGGLVVGVVDVPFLQVAQVN